MRSELITKRSQIVSRHLLMCVSCALILPWHCKNVVRSMLRWSRSLGRVAFFWFISVNDLVARGCVNQCRKCTKYRGLSLFRHSQMTLFLHCYGAWVERLFKFRVARDGIKKEW